MAHRWSDKDANGNPLGADGRYSVCLVVTSDESPDMPPMYYYGKTKEECWEKLAKTAETAQTTIHKLRSKTAQPAPPAQPQAVGQDEIVMAIADLQNPAKAASAIKVLLRAGGLNVEQEINSQVRERIKGIAAQWERDNPDFPNDPRNSRILINFAAARVGFVNITAAVLDQAYRELQRSEMLFEPPPNGSTVQPDTGNPASRTVRLATSHRRGALSSTEEPVNPQPNKRHKYTKEEIAGMNSKVLGEKIRHEPGFSEEFDRVMAS